MLYPLHIMLSLKLSIVIHGRNHVKIMTYERHDPYLFFGLIMIYHVTNLRKDLTHSMHSMFLY